jgi:hypothetical protein
MNPEPGHWPPPGRWPPLLFLFYPREWKYNGYVRRLLRGIRAGHIPWYI